jgi:hypothetical protein
MEEKLYYKVIDDQTKEVLVAFGTDVEWFKSLGYVDQGNVEQGTDGRYYLSGYLPNTYLDELKTAKSEQVKSAYLKYRADEATVPSTLGFTADANTRAWTDVMGLATKAQSAAEGEKITFRAADNTFHEITRDQLGTLLLEIIAAGEDSYAQKWAMDKAIEAAATKDELDAIDITFKSPAAPIVVDPLDQVALMSNLKAAGAKGAGIHVETLGNQAYDDITSILFRSPYIHLSDHVDGNVAVDLILPTQGVSYYACMDEPHEVSPNKSGALFFDDEMTHGGAYLDVDRIQKAYGIQETDDKDPNITGGSSFNIVSVVAMSGVAPSDGKVRLWLQALDPLRQPTGILADENGNPIAVEKHYKAGDKLDRLVIDRFVNAKAIAYFRVMVDNGFADPLVLEDRTQGNTCLLIQESTTKSRIGEGGLQFQLDSGLSLKNTRHYFGTGAITTSWLTQSTVPVSAGGAGEAYTMADGWGLNALSSLQAGVTNGKIQIMPDGSAITDFDFHKIMSPEKTTLLRGKVLNVSFVGEAPDSGFELALMSWTGTGRANEKILSGRNNTAPVFSSGWSKAASIFVSENAQGSQTITGEFTVPTDAKQFAVCIYPVAAQNPCTLRISKLQCDAKAPFTTHIHAPTGVVEDRLFYRERMQRFIQDSEGFVSLRYTVNDTWSNCPVGAQKDRGDVTLNNKVQIIPGSAATGGEGALVFPNDGTADISVTFRVLNEQKDESLFTAKLVYVGSDGAVADLPSDIASVKVAGGSVGSVVTLRAKKISVKAGEMIGIQARSDRKDGCYLQSNSHAEPLVETIVDYTELTK